MQALTADAAKLRIAGWGEVPEFDPLNGGVAARILFLFEKPGPMTSVDRRPQRSGSGFISRDNDDPTAEATFTFMREAGIPRRSTVLWNVVPGWNGTRAITRTELGDGVSHVGSLVGLLPQLEAVVLVGKKAGMAHALLKLLGLAVSGSDHPSPVVRARWPERWARIPATWRAAMRQR